MLCVCIYITGERRGREGVEVRERLEEGLPEWGNEWKTVAGAVVEKEWRW